jgi:hypothetical protein
LTFRSAVTGSGVVVDDTGDGVTLFGDQPVLCTAVSLKNQFVLFLISLLFYQILQKIFNQDINVIISYFLPN